jgi:hypothetical protein
MSYLFSCRIYFKFQFQNLLLDVCVVCMFASVCVPSREWAEGLGYWRSAVAIYDETKQNDYVSDQYCPRRWGCFEENNGVIC